jgi:16S rRNA (cytidine1402-2'-O)-methyltransferase
VDGLRRVAVCRELTKRFEEVARGTAAELAARFAEPPKGEIALVIGAAGGVAFAVGEAEAAAAVAELVAAGVGRNQAARLVARLTGVPKRNIYRTSL